MKLYLLYPVPLGVTTYFFISKKDRDNFVAAEGGMYRKPFKVSPSVFSGLYEEPKFPPLGYEGKVYVKKR